MNGGRKELYLDGSALRADDRPIKVMEFLFPVDVGDLTVLTRVTEYIPPEMKKDRATLVLMGGGASEAFGSMWMTDRLRRAGISARTLTLSHVAGSGAAGGNKKEPVKPDWDMGVEVLGKVLQKSDLRVDLDSLVFVGYSNGGAQVMALASSIAKRETLVLCEPAGMAKNPRFLYEFVVGSLFSVAYKHYKKLGWSPEGIRKAFCDEMGASWVTPKGTVGSIKGVLRELFLEKESQRDMLEVAEEFGVLDNSRRMILDPILSSEDTTACYRENIEGNVVFAPVLGANVLNLMVNEMREKYRNGRELMRAWRINSQEVKDDMTKVLKVKFPFAEDVHLSIYPGWTHSSVVVDQEYWDELAKVMSKFI